MTDYLDIQLDENAVLPERAYPSDAGLDLFAPKGFHATIWPKGYLKIDTGVHVAIPEGYKGEIAAKSGHMAERGLLTAGTIDCGYTGSICVVLFNFGDACFEIVEGMKLAQLVVERIITPKLRVVDRLEETERGYGGFGSTGYFPRRSYFSICYDQDGERHNDLTPSGDVCGECCPIDLDALCGDGEAE